jgi:hypothetical protein
VVGGGQKRARGRIWLMHIYSPHLCEKVIMKPIFKNLQESFKREGGEGR